MKHLLVCFVLLSFVPANACADVILGTTGSPLSMGAGTISGPMTLTVSSGSGNVMYSWNATLQIVPLGGATGTVTFQSASQPSNYVLANGLGISSNNTGTQLTANDFDLLGGSTVPSSANLLSLTFAASNGASGSFGIYAVPGDPVGTGVPLTYWNNGSSFTDMQFANVPGGSQNVLLGQVNVTPAAAGLPEPSTLTILGLSIAGVAGWRWRRKKSFTSNA